MPRKARLSIPGCVTHIMAHCLDRVKLFGDNEDRQYFVNLLSKYVKETGCRCYAWALMANHYHLLIRTGASDLWRTMKPLNMRYAQFHGRKYGRRGPLFMDRYKSIVTSDQNYVQELVRYVHLNPLRAGVCRSLTELDKYPWTGHAVLIGRRSDVYQDTDAVLRRFGTDLLSARREYRRFLNAGIGETGDNYLLKLVRRSNHDCQKNRSVGCWVIGDQKFVTKVITESVSRRLRIRQTDASDERLLIIGKKVCDTFGVPKKVLFCRHRGGPGSEARKVFCFLCVRQYGAATKRVAEFLGVNPGSASNMLRAGERVAMERNLLKI